ncbi:MAG: hypothetical protein ACI9N9_002796 [Enterobacterales bacterium]|jgi:hypothetical protein
MIMRTLTTLLAFISILFTTSCSNSNTSQSMQRSTEQRAINQAPYAPKVITTQCTNPRPEICTMDYKPVCAARGTGARCITTPCPSTEKATYSNGCTACSDAKVNSYQLAKCDSKESVRASQ